MNSKRIIIIPLLIVLYYFVHYVSDLFYFLDAWQTCLQVMKYLLVAGLLLLAGYRLFSNKEKFVLAYSTTLFVFLFYGSLVDTAATAGLLKQATGVSIVMMAGFISLCVLVIFICSRLAANAVKKLLQFWLIYCLVLVVYDGGSFILTEKKEKKYLSAATTTAFTSADKPAVFFLLFDMYPSDTVLKQYLGYDNAAISNFLKEKNFFVTGNAHSLYSETYYSLASTLSLQPLAYVDDSAFADYKKKLIALKNIRYSSLPAMFERAGYTFRNFSVFDLQGQQSPLLFNLNYHLAHALTGTTFFNRLYDGFEPDFFLASRNIDLSFVKQPWSSNVKNDLAFLDSSFNRVLNGFDAVSKPSFNYFHFMMPHPPIIYDSSGKENAVKDMYAYRGFDHTNKMFAGYIKYANSQLKKMVDKIFEKAGKNVVIIIQGDHGYREFQERLPDAVRHGVLNAVYLPAGNYRGFNDTMTVLHTFQQLLQNQFGVIAHRPQ